MIRTIIIDDEPDGIGSLAELLKNFTSVNVKIVGTATNLPDGVKLIHSLNPDLVFLDINMPKESGMNIYKYFPNPKFNIIFVTAYSQYAIEALKKSALDYLLKPVDYLELDDALKKLLKKLKEEQNLLQLDDYLKQLNAPNIPGKNIVINTEHGFFVENSKNIEYCKADQSYSMIYTNNGKEVTISKPLKYLEDLLPTNQFIRTHKSFLVNILYIRQYVRADENYIILKSGKRIPVSVRKNTDFDDVIKNLFEN
jgi:two-component system LytT family response regulator